MEAKLYIHKQHYFCHATALENLDSIIKNGIKANENGEIFLYEDCFFTCPPLYANCYVGDHIAENQIFIQGEEYVNFIIPSYEITGVLERDNVGEITSRMQWIAKQAVIYPTGYEIRTIGKQRPRVRFTPINKAKEG